MEMDLLLSISLGTAGVFLRPLQIYQLTEVTKFPLGTREWYHSRLEPLYQTIIIMILINIY